MRSTPHKSYTPYESGLARCSAEVCGPFNTHTQKVYPMNWNYVGVVFFACLAALSVYGAGPHATQALAALFCWGQALILLERGRRKSLRLPK